MATIGKLSVIIQANADQMNKVLDDVEHRLHLFQNAGGGGGGSGLMAGLVGGGAAGVAMAAVNSITSASGGAVDMAKSLASTVLDVGKNAVLAFADLESTQIAFEGMLGSAEKAAALMEDLRKLDRSSPFTMKELTTGSQRLLQFGLGLEDTKLLMSNLANVAAASPQGMAKGMNRITLAIGQMAARGKVSMQEMNQLSEAGVPALQALADRLGVSTAQAMKMIESGTVSARNGIQSVLDLASSSKFAGLAEKQAQGLKGLWSTLTSGAVQLQEKLGEMISKTFDLKGAAAKVLDFIDLLRNKIILVQPAMEAVGEIFKAVLDTALAFGTGAVNALAAWLGKTSEASEGIGSWRDVTLDALEAISAGLINIAKYLDITIQKSSKLGDFLAGFLDVTVIDPLTQLDNSIKPSAALLELEEQMRNVFQNLRKGTEEVGGLSKAINEYLNAFDTSKLSAVAGSVADKLEFGKTTSAFAGMMDSLRTPLEMYQAEMLQFEQMLARDLANNIDSTTQYVRAAEMAMKKLQQATGMGENKLPTALEAGSREAVSAIIKAQNQNAGGNIQERMKQTLDRAEKHQQRTADNTARMLEYLKKTGGIGLAKLGH